MPQTFGKFLRRVRRAREITQADIALLVGVTQVTESRWEAEELAPAAEHHAALARFLHVPVADVREMVLRQQLEQKRARLRRDLSAVEGQIHAFGTLPKRKR